MPNPLRTASVYCFKSGSVNCDRSAVQDRVGNLPESFGLRLSFAGRDLAVCQGELRKTASIIKGV